MKLGKMPRQLQSSSQLSKFRISPKQNQQNQSGSLESHSWLHRKLLMINKKSKLIRVAMFGILRQTWRWWLIKSRIQKPRKLNPSYKKKRKKWKKQRNKKLEKNYSNQNQSVIQIQKNSQDTSLPSPVNRSLNYRFKRKLIRLNRPKKINKKLIGRD